MSLSAIDIVVAGASAASAIFVGYQSFLLTSSLNSPFAANLQSRQIEVCARAIREKGSYLSKQNIFDTDLGFWGKNLAEMKSDSESDIGALSDIWGKSVDSAPFNKAIAESIFSAVDASDFRASLEELKIYSSKKTVAKVDQVIIALSGISFSEVLGGKNEESSPLPIKNVESAFSAVEIQCRAAMLGEIRGLL